MVRTDFKLRYQGSILGYLWSLLKPLLLFLIMYIVFTKFLHIGKGVPNYPLSLLLGLVLWNFFIESTSSALQSIVSRGSLIRKINIPRYLIPISVIASAFINMLLNLTVVFIFVLFVNPDALSWRTAVFMPLLLVELIAFSVSIGFFLSAVYVKYRDIEHIWDVVRQAFFYMTPIIYPLTLIPYELVRKVLLINPIGQIIQDARSIVTYDKSIQINDVYGTSLAILLPLAVIVIVGLVSTAYFRSKSKYFAEDI